ncbi:MAG: hypothetical protein WDZ69_03045 [Candidatus Pacearchaeota archaeon]
MSDYGFPEKRQKRKHKKKEKKRHPYKTGGKERNRESSGRKKSSK